MGSVRFIVAIFLSVLISGQIFAAHHFAEVYDAGGAWKVDHFEVESGKLQDLVESRSFEYEVQARQFAVKIKALNQNKSLLSSLKLVTTETKTEPLWVVKNEWDQNWEDKYADWVAKNLDRLFFVKHSLATDCADVAYALRWIFARNNFLPAAATLAASGVIVSHLSAKTEWNNLSAHVEWNKDQRFLAALNWLLDSVYTKTLYVDTYPVALAKQNIKPGLINLLGGHTEIFNKVSYRSDEVPLEVVSSTVPRAVRELAARPFLDSQITAKEDGGLVNFRWPKNTSGNSWNMIEKEEMPEFSMEQYQERICEEESGFAFCLFKKLGMSFRPELVLEKIIISIEETVKQRTQIVKDGFVYCQVNDCSPGTIGWEDWGTPSRDGRLTSSISYAGEIASNIGMYQNFVKWLENTKLPGMDLTYKKFHARLAGGLVSIDPRDSIEARWALTFVAMQSTLYKIYDQGQSLRTNLIYQAESCRKDPVVCQKSKKTFQELNTLEIDLKIRGVILAWHNFCKVEECPIEKNLDQLYQDIWFRSPLPWDSIARRNGDLSSRPLSHLLDDQVLKVVGDKYLILSGNKIYDLQKREIVKVFSGQVGFEKSLGLFYSVSQSTDFSKVLSLYDMNFQLVSQTNYEDVTGYMSSSVFYELGHGKLLLGLPVNTSYTSPGRPFRLFDLNKGTIQELGNYNSMKFESSGEQNRILLIGEKDVIVNAEAQEISVTHYPQLPKSEHGSFSIEALIHLTRDEYLISYRSYEEGISYVIKYTPSLIEKLFESAGLEITKINPHFFYIRMYEEELEYLFDEKMNFYFKGESLSLTKAGKEISFLLHSTNGKTWQAALIGSQTIQHLPALTFKENTYVFSASDKWISVWSENGFMALDYQGTVLEQSTFKARGLCAPSFEQICQEPEGNLLVELIPSLATGNHMNFYQVGKTEGFKLTDPLAYLISEENGGIGDISISSWDSDLNDLNEGIEIKLREGTYLWYPKF